MYSRLKQYAVRWRVNCTMEGIQYGGVTPSVRDETYRRYGRGYAVWTCHTISEGGEGIFHVKPIRYIRTPKLKHHHPKTE